VRHLFLPIPTLTRSAAPLQRVPPQGIVRHVSLDRNNPAVQVVRTAVERGPIPGASMAFIVDGTVTLAQAGHLTRDEGSPTVDAATIYDLASLSKTLCTATLLAAAAEEGRLDPRAPLADTFPFLKGLAVGNRSAIELAAHTAGFEAHSPLKHLGLTGEAALERALIEPAPFPRGQILYSDHGYIVLGYLLERLYGERLNDLAARRLFGPIGLEIGFSAPRERCAPSEWPPEEPEPLRGVVHDEKARLIARPTGHAGLFATAEAVARFIVALLEGRVLGKVGMALLTSEQARGTYDRRALGWAMTDPHWSGGSKAPPNALGHTGFTGTGAWFDPESGCGQVLLTNRTYPHRDLPSGIVPLRRAFSNACWANATE
jgi:CubicO group peptidase (beta-lactamase class C family)